MKVVLEIGFTSIKIVVLVGTRGRPAQTSVKTGTSLIAVTFTNRKRLALCGHITLPGCDCALVRPGQYPQYISAVKDGRPWVAKNAPLGAHAPPNQFHPRRHKPTWSTHYPMTDGSPLRFLRRLTRCSPRAVARWGRQWRFSFGIRPSLQ